MFELFIQITDLPVEGREFSFTEPRIWTEPIAEFRLPFHLGPDFQARVMVRPHEQGCLINGVMGGHALMACARCTEDVEYAMDVEFEEFEAVPGSHLSDEVCWIVSRDGLLFLDIAGFLWEQFQLALPVKTLCSPNCRGICPVCGANKNHLTCHCATQTGDPRWEALRSVQVP